MAERRVRQFAIPGSLMADLPQVSQTVSALDALLKAAGYVPATAICLYHLISEMQDCTLLRYHDISFAPLEDFAPIETVIVLPDILRIANG